MAKRRKKTNPNVKVLFGPYQNVWRPVQEKKEQQLLVEDNGTQATVSEQPNAFSF